VGTLNSPSGPLFVVKMPTTNTNWVTIRANQIRGELTECQETARLGASWW
jgi:hypothetical protein